MPAEPRSDRDTPSGDWAFTLAAAAVALLPRLFVAIAWAREPVWDGHYYHAGAERIAEGLGYSEDVMIGGHAVWKPVTHYPVGYSAILAIAYKLAGSGLVVAPLFNVLIGSALVVVVHRLARHWLSPTRARIAAGLTALHPGLIAYTAVVMTESLAALLLLLSGLFAVRWRNARGVLAAGVTLGLATLVRPSSLLAVPLLALIKPRPALRAIVGSGLALVIALGVVLPWTIRNCIRMDGCALVSTNGGWNLAIGALTDTGRFRTLRAADGCPVVTGQVQQDRCWAKVGLSAILKAPGGWLALAPKKLAQTYDHESFAIEYLREADPTQWPEPRRIAARQLLTWFHRLLLGAAVLAGVALVTRRPMQGPSFVERIGGRPWLAQGAALAALAALFVYAVMSDDHPFFWLALAAPLLAVLHLPGRPTQGATGRFLLGLLFATSLTHVLFFGDDRYHIVVSPVLCLLGAAALRKSESENP